MPGAINEFAPAKINLALHVLGRRADGLHELDSIVAFADVGDELGITPSTEFSIAASGPFAHLLPAPENNIVFAAWKAVAAIAAARGAHLPPVAVELVKNLPVAAGIGGGSANAAAAMRGFLRLVGIEGEVESTALKLGADVPVCLLSKACRMQGVGERLTVLENFAPLHAVLVNPMIEVSTAAVFEKLGLAKGEGDGAPISPREGEVDVMTWRNDLTPAATAIAPAIAEVFTALKSQPGLRFARMSGSGATCFGVFESGETAEDAARKVSASRPDWWVRQATLS